MYVCIYIYIYIPRDGLPARSTSTGGAPGCDLKAGRLD